MAHKPHAPACERNRDAILEVLRRSLPDRGRVLEIGSGTGQHAVYFAETLPGLLWQPTERAAALPGIEAWRAEAALPNLARPLCLDVARDPWPPGPYDAVFTADTLHIMSWDEVCALFAALQGVMASDAVLIVYGPFRFNGGHTADSNRAFDEWLQARSPAMGLRDFEAVDALARGAGLMLVERCAMPANNFCAVWRRATESR
jgi:cyclopropane fatty-acyl-phospholipid synthase-like methyltransferase